MNDLLKMKMNIENFGIEDFGRYYGSYFGEVIEYNSELNRINVRVDGLLTDNSIFENVPLQGYPNLNLPLVKGDKVMVSFLWGHISYPIAQYAYHTYDKTKNKSNKDKDVVSQDYIKFKSKSGLLVEELKNGFKIKKGKVLLEMTEDKVLFSINGASITLDSDFEVKVNGDIKLNDKKRNKVISFDGMMSTLKMIQQKHNSHTHTFISPGQGILATTSAVMTSSGLIAVISSQAIGLNNVFAG